MNNKHVIYIFKEWMLNKMKKKKKYIKNKYNWKNKKRILIFIIILMRYYDKRSPNN